IAIDDPARAQVAADRVDVRIEVAAAEVAPVELVQEDVERDDLEGRYRVALLRFAERRILRASGEHRQRDDRGSEGFHRPERPAIQAFSSKKRRARVSLP